MRLFLSDLPSTLTVDIFRSQRFTGLRSPRLSLFFIFFTLLAGCAGPRIEPQTPAREDLSNTAWVKQVLYSQYDEWKAVKYKAGGLSKAGVDCSGFVYLTFDNRFSIKLPRSTDAQVGAGTPIDQRALVAGDLVFFKTGKTIRHVGIYIEDGKFVHASTEKGVMISRLEDEYWSRNYWKSIRPKS